MLFISLGTGTNCHFIEFFKIVHMFNSMVLKYSSFYDSSIKNTQSSEFRDCFPMKTIEIKFNILFPKISANVLHDTLNDVSTVPQVYSHVCSKPGNTC